MDDAALVFCLRESRLNRLPDPGQPVSADDLDVLDPAILKAVENGQPVLGALVIADLDCQDTFLSFAADSKDDVSRHLPNGPIVPDGVVDRVDVENRIDVIEKPVLPVLNLGQDLIRYVRYETLRGFKPIDIYECVENLAGGHPLGIHGDNFLVNVRDVFLPLFDNFGIKCGLAVLWDIDPHRTVAGVDSFFFVAVAIVVGVGALGFFVSEMVIHLGGTIISLMVPPSSSLSASWISSAVSMSYSCRSCWMI